MNLQSQYIHIVNIVKKLNLKKMKKTNDMTDEVAKQECSNNKCYTSAFRYIYIYIYNMLANPRKSL